MPTPRPTLYSGLCVLLAILAAAPSQAVDWPLLDADATTMTAEPKAPGAPAIYLYRQVDRDDQSGDEVNMLAVKILTEEGRDRANVQIAYERSRETISGIEARTIRPDGTVVKFDGKVYGSTIVKARDAKLMAKSFTLPDVQVGSIIEYRYRRLMGYGYVYDSQWLLEDDLFTKHGVFTLRASDSFPMVWSWPVGLPPGTEPPVRKAGLIRMEVHDVPAFVTEEYMPPESALKYRVDFDYQEVMPDRDSDKFWKHFAKERFNFIDNFIDHRRAMEKALAQIIEPADRPEVRLQKIYDRVQRLRNFDYMPERSEEERQREKISRSDDADDVWSRGYGDGYQITWLFLALVRAAGLQADPVEVSTRDRYFFMREMNNARALNTNVVRIHLGDKDIYADPGTSYAPLGLLPWFESGVTGLVLAKDGGTWVKTPLPSEKESRLERNATFTLSADGSLEGRLVVTFYGLEALTRRLRMRNEDARARKEWLEDEIKGYVPTGIDVSLTNAPDWTASSNALRAEFDLRIPGFAERAGSRLLLPLAVFRAHEGKIFTHAERVRPVYFDFPFTFEDTVVITTPAGYEPTGLPDPFTRDAGAVHYRDIADFHDGKLTARRHVDVTGILYPVKAYAPLHEFFQGVRAGDEEQVVLAKVKTNAPR